MIAGEYLNDKKPTTNKFGRGEKRSSHCRNNRDSKMVYNLNCQSIIMCEVRQKLALIYDISNSNHLSKNNVDGGTKNVEKNEVI